MQVIFKEDDGWLFSTKKCVCVCACMCARVCVCARMCACAPACTHKHTRGAGIVCVLCIFSVGEGSPDGHLFVYIGKRYSPWENLNGRNLDKVEIDCVKKKVSVILPFQSAMLDRMIRDPEQKS